MTESSTLTVSQELFNKLGIQHPGKQMLKVIERIEKLEAVHIGAPSFTGTPTVTGRETSLGLTRSEKMKASWAKRKAKLV